MRHLIVSSLFVVWASLSVATAPAAASDTREITLEDALRTARAGNPRLRAARHAVESARGREEQARAWPNPEISLVAEDVPRGGGLSDGKNLVGVSQTVPFPMKKTYEGRAGRSEAQWLRSTYDLAAVELDRDVKIAFYRVLAAEQRVTVSREAARVAAALADAVRQRVEAGAAALQEELRAEIEQERANTDLFVGEAERDLSRETLFILMGEPPHDAQFIGELSWDTTLTRGVPGDPTYALPEAEPGAAPDIHPLLAGAEARVERAEHELRRAKLNLLPDFDFSFSLGRDEADDDVYEVEAAIAVPLFDFGGGVRREKRAELEAARAEAAATGLDLQASRRNASQNFLAAARRSSAYRDRIVPRAEQALELVRGGFEAGKFGLIDLLDTQRTLAEARRSYIETLFELNSARAEWEALNATSIPTSSKE